MNNEPNDVRVPVMMSATLRDAIDEWRRAQPDLPSRSEAIRALCCQALGLALENSGSPTA
ncbi:MAG: hypothetical protein VYB54_07500 [Pseudomonadota bacterium]|nr:hypothetical protein [Pseudomonadota bacterium]